MTLLRENRRGAWRLRHEFPVAWRGEGGYRSGCATDMSASGLFINAAEPFPVGTELKLLISLPAVDSPVSMRGRVARLGGVGEPAGMGIRFTGVEPGRTRELADLLRRMRRDLGS